MHTRMHLCLVLLCATLSIVGVSEGGSVGGPDLSHQQQQKLDAALMSSFRASNSLSSSDSETISVIMRTLMPSMFNLFSNITSDEYKAQFAEPCRFDALLEIFSQLPAYFDVIAKKYAPKNDLVAYYSMQLASTFLVNNNSLTMTCLYNMMSLQSRLKSFSIDLMDNPEKNFHLVGLFGFFIKPVMSLLKQNAMMKIIDHVEKYESNDDLSTVTTFNVLNCVFVALGIVGILSNVLLVILLKRAGNVSTGVCTKNKPYANKQVVLVKNTPKPIYKSSQQKESKPKKSQYKIVKSRHYYLNQFIRRKYTTRECFMIIAICHSFYILINYMIMSQTSLAAHALKGLTKLNAACKLAFFLSPPTTAYNMLHQVAIWLLVFALRRHANKLRATRFRTNVAAVIGGGENCMTLYGGGRDDDGGDGEESDDETEDGSNTETQSADLDALRYDEQNDTLSQSLTNNSNRSQQQNHMMRPIQSYNVHKSTVHFINEANGGGGGDNSAAVAAATATAPNPAANDDMQNRSLINNNPNANSSRYALIPPPQPSAPIGILAHNTPNHYHHHHNHHNHHRQTPPVQIVTSNFYHQANLFALPNAAKVSRKTTGGAVRAARRQATSRLMSISRVNYLFALGLVACLLVYNAQNLIFYKLNELNTGAQMILFCAFDDAYADYYSMLTQFLVPFVNLFLFAILPLTLLTVQVLLDACFLIRVRREQMKRYMKLSDTIEWPLYAYYVVYMASQLPYALHQLVDLAAGSTKFPFVFPLFIQMKFSSHVWVVIVEQTLIFLAYSCDLFIWLVVDKQMREICAYWLNKRILCRTYTKDSSESSSSTSSSTRSCSSSSGASKSSSDSSVINEEPIKLPLQQQEQQQLVKEHEKQLKKSSAAQKSPQPASTATTTTTTIAVGERPTSYASSTLTSTSSHTTNGGGGGGGGSKKKSSPLLLPPHIVNGVKASAALSASASTNSPQYSPPLPPANNDEDEDDIIPNTNIKMIDTDEDIDDAEKTAASASASASASATTATTSLVRMSEQNIDPSSTSTTTTATTGKHYSFNHNYDRHPPSFKTVMSKSSSITQHHQYQNDDFDLDIHNTK